MIPRSHALASTFLYAIGLIAGVVSPASAQCPQGGTVQLESHSVTVDMSLGTWDPTAVRLPAFDPEEHPNSELVRVELHREGLLQASVFVENPWTWQTCRYDWRAVQDVYFLASPALGVPLRAIKPRISEGELLDYFDGLLDYDGPSGESWPNETNLGQTPTIVVTDPSVLAGWTGDGLLDLEHRGENGSLFGYTPCTFLEVMGSGQCTLTLRVDYFYCVTELGLPYCFGDGSGSICPCGNTGGSDGGCANTFGTGAVVSATGSDSAAADDLVFDGQGLPPMQPVLLFAGLNPVAGGDGAPFGDGLRCAGGDVRRLGIEFADGLGNTRHGPGLIEQGGLGAGETRRFQLWYRDPGGLCGTGFNLSNGLELTLSP